MRILKVAKRLCCVGILNTGGVFIATGHDPAPVAAGSLWFTLQGEFGHVGFLGSATEGGVRGCEGGMCGELAKGHRADTGARNARRVSRGIRPDHQRATRYELRPAAAAARRPSRGEGWGGGGAAESLPASGRSVCYCAGRGAPALPRGVFLCPGTPGMQRHCWRRLAQATVTLGQRKSAVTDLWPR